MKYNYVTQEISITKEELNKGFSDIKKFSTLVDDIIYLWLTEACGFTHKEAMTLINRGRNEKYEREVKQNG